MGDLRIALRTLSKTPGATLLSVLSIALAIALTAGLFGITDAAFLNPFHLKDPSKILSVISTADDGQKMSSYGWLDFEDMASAAKGQAELTAYQSRGAVLDTHDSNEILNAYAVTPNHFSFLGVKTALGRATVSPAGSQPAVVIGDRLWRRRFGADPQIVGKTIRLNNRAFLVTGVLPADYAGLELGGAIDVWMSTDAWFDVLEYNERHDRNGSFALLARLRPGVSGASIASRLDAAIRGPEKHRPAPAGSSGTYFDNKLTPNPRGQVIAGAALSLLLGLILFAGCANAAQLRMAQAELRRRELAIRQALGAGSWRVLRLLLMESALLTATGAALGLLLAEWLLRTVSEYVSQAYLYIDLRMNWQIVGVVMGAALLSVFLAGFVPAVQALRFNVNDTLKSEQGVTGARTEWRKRALVTAQMAAGVLFFGIALLAIQSSWHARNIRPAIDPTKRMIVLNMTKDLRWPILQWAETAADRLSRIPGVRGVTYARRVPLSESGGGMTVRVEIPGQSPRDVRLNHVAGNYCSLMGTRILAGRGIDASDRASTTSALVVSQYFARHLLGGSNPVGRWIKVAGKPRQIVGIAEDGPSEWFHESESPYLYLPFSELPWGEATFIVETANAPERLLQTALREFKRFDREATTLSASTLEQKVNMALLPDTLAAGIATTLGAFALLLTATGLFGVIQFSVARRTREIGLRVAVGARPADIQKMVLAQSLRLAAWAIPIGLVLVAIAARLVRSALIGVTDLDPATYIVSAVTVTVLALAAAWLPGARAARVDPLTALRAE